MRTLQRECEELPQVRAKNLELRTTNLCLQLRLENLEKDDRLKRPVSFDGRNNYRRENLVALSQFISQNLENRPSKIDPKKIFNCVKSCYYDLNRNYRNNPAHYRLDMRMGYWRHVLPVFGFQTSRIKISRCGFPNMDGYDHLVSNVN